MKRPKYRIIKEDNLYFIEKRFLWFWDRAETFGPYGNTYASFLSLDNAIEALENYKKYKSFRQPAEIVMECE